MKSQSRRGSQGGSSTSGRSSGRSSHRSSGGRSSRGRSSSNSFLGIEGLPGWAPYAITVVSICGLVYGLMQISVVSEFVDPMLEDVGEFFGLSDEDSMELSRANSDHSYSTIE